MQFTEESISVSFKEKEHEYTVYYRPIWSWACDLMKNAKIASKFHWDARQIYRYSDKTKSFMRFYDEPWTGDRFWEIQVLSMGCITFYEFSFHCSQDCRTVKHGHSASSCMPTKISCHHSDLKRVIQSPCDARICLCLCATELD